MEGLDEGLTELEQAGGLAPGNTLYLAQLGQAYGMAGKDDRGPGGAAATRSSSRGRDMCRLTTWRTSTPDSVRRIARWTCLEQAYEERAGSVYGIKGSFLFTALHSHPRFMALLRKMNLA